MGENQKSIREIHQIGKGTTEYLINLEQCPSMKRLGIWLAGISCATPQFQFVRHKPNMRQVLVCFRGEGEVWIDHQWKKCTSGMAYITPERAYHAYRGLGKQWEIGWCIYGFSPKTSAEDYWKNTLQPSLVETDPRQLESILQGLYHEASHHADSEALEYWTALLDAQTRRILLPQITNSLWRLWQSVQSDLSYPWTLEILAKKAGLETEQLRRMCHRETSRSPMRQVTYLRMQHAMSLLAANQKMEVVSDAVGYETPFAFSTAFKRTIGRSPSSFRKKLG